MPKYLKKIFTLGLSLLLAAAWVAQADDAPGFIRKAIDEKFPGATIKEIEQEAWQGQPVIEVDLTTRDGIDYEMRFSESGEVLTIEEDKELPWIGGELSLGLAALAERDIYKDVGTEFQGQPFFMYENGPLEIRATENIDATYNVYRTERFSFGVNGYLSLDQEGYDIDDSAFLVGMDELHTLYGAGLEMETMFGGWEAGLEVSQDLSGEHDGQEVELSLVYPWMVGGFELRPALSLTWISEKTVDYFYGVSATEARADRPVYSPGSSYEVGAGLMIQRPFLENYTLVGIIEISTFGNDITDSPLVDEDYAIETVLGVMYTF